MARAAKKTKFTVVGGEDHAPVGHNSGATVQELNDDQQQALFFQHKKKIGGLKDKIASLTGDLRSAYKVAKAEGFTKKDIDYAFSLEKDDDEKMVEERRRQEQIARWLGHPIGTQADLFGTGKPTDDRPLKERAFDEGKRDGMKSEGPLNPPYDPGNEAYEAYIEGWHKGQEAIFNVKQKVEDPPAPLLRPEGNEPAEADEFDEASEGDAFDASAEAEAEPWPDDRQVAEREPAEAL